MFEIPRYGNNSDNKTKRYTRVTESVYILMQLLVKSKDFFFFFNSTHSGNFTGFTEWTMNTSGVCQISNKEIWQDDQKH